MRSTFLFKNYHVLNKKSINMFDKQCVLGGPRHFLHWQTQQYSGTGLQCPWVCYPHTDPCTRFLRSSPRPQSRCQTTEKGTNSPPSWLGQERLASLWRHVVVTSALSMWGFSADVRSACAVVVVRFCKVIILKIKYIVKTCVHF